MEEGYAFLSWYQNFVLYVRCTLKPGLITVRGWPRDASHHWQIMEVPRDDWVDVLLPVEYRGYQGLPGVSWAHHRECCAVAGSRKYCRLVLPALLQFPTAPKWSHSRSRGTWQTQACVMQRHKGDDLSELLHYPALSAIRPWTLLVLCNIHNPQPHTIVMGNHQLAMN